MSGAESIELQSFSVDQRGPIALTQLGTAANEEISSDIDYLLPNPARGREIEVFCTLCAN
jgi:hypothetical protein